MDKSENLSQKYITFYIYITSIQIYRFISFLLIKHSYFSRSIFIQFICCLRHSKRCKRSLLERDLKANASFTLDSSKRKTF